MVYQLKIEVLLALGLGIYWIIFTHFLGLGLSPDSTHYLVYALNMHYSANWLNLFSLTVNPLWAPFYSFLINIFMFFTPLPLEAATLLGGISMLLFLITFTLILRQFSNNLVLNLLFLMNLLVLIGFLDSYLYILSEAPFALFIILHFYFLIKHEQTHKIKYYIFQQFLFR
jgi:hypothetical protein